MTIRSRLTQQIPVTLAVALLWAGPVESGRPLAGVLAEDPSGVPWVRYGVVLDLGRKGSPDDRNIESPVVLRRGRDDYVLWYRGQTWADKTGRVMRAVSLDGIHWTKTGVVMEPRTDYEGGKIDPMLVLYENGEYRMWYGAGARGGSACLAISPDGIHWTRHPDNPVLAKTSKSWDNRGAGGQHTVLCTEHGYRMLYKGFGSETRGWTFYGLAESDDGVAWRKRGKSIAPDPDAGETTTFKNLFAFRGGEDYYLLHTMADRLELFLHVSPDGERWNRRGLVFSKGLTPGRWDEKWTTSPCLLLEDGMIRMWSEGGDPRGRVRTLYAEVPLEELCGRRS